MVSFKNQAWHGCFIQLNKYLKKNLILLQPRNQILFPFKKVIPFQSNKKLERLKRYA